MFDVNPDKKKSRHISIKFTISETTSNLLQYSKVLTISETISNVLQYSRSEV
jgi:hypothetical protein